MTRISRLPTRLAAFGCLAMAAACSQTTDFGRSTVDPNAHYAAIQARPNDDAIHFALTDEEREMNARITRFMTMSHTEPWLHRAALARVGVVDDEQLDETAYFNWIKSEQFASSRGPYNRLQNDIRLDLATLPQTFAAICKVVEIDRRRELAADSLVRVEIETQTAAAERLAENRERINQFAAALDFRYDAYVYALEHLLVETPHEQARDIDADLSSLATASGAASAGNYCTQPRQLSATATQTGLGAI